MKQTSDRKHLAVNDFDHQAMMGYIKLEADELNWFMLLVAFIMTSDCITNKFDCPTATIHWCAKCIVSISG